MNLFATVLTYPAPSANYRGESEQNRTVIQKITDGRLEYPIISPEAMRNALREILASYGLPCNRSRLHDEEQLAVRFADYPNPEEYIDDFFFGYFVAAGSADRKKIVGELKKNGRNSFQFKRDSILRMNLAKGLEPYRHDSVFTQSPRNSEDSPWKNADASALLHRETVQTAFQYPFALNLNECREARFKKEAGEGETETIGLKYLLKAIGELNGVSGNHRAELLRDGPSEHCHQAERIPGCRLQHLRLHKRRRFSRSHRRNTKGRLSRRRILYRRENCQRNVRGRCPNPQGAEGHS